MEFNKIVSLVLGFIVVVLLLVFVAGKMRGNSTSKVLSGRNVTATPTPTKTAQAKKDNKGWNPFGFLFNKNTPTPTPSKAATQVARNVTPTNAAGQTGGMTGTTQGGQTKGGQPLAQNNGAAQPQNQGTYNTVSGVTQIPNTGAPTAMIPLALSMLTGGVYLSRMKRN